MRYESLVIGVLFLLLGIYLVSTQGSVAGVSLPSLIGLPCGTGSTSNATGCTGFGGFGIGTVVALFGIGLAANGLRAPSMPSMRGRDGAVALPAEMQAILASAHARMAQPSGPGSTGGRFCSKCGGPNTIDARFCSRCGAAMPPPN